MALGVGFRDPPPRGPDHDRDLAFVVELSRLGRTQQVRAVPDERPRKAREHARVLRRRGAVLVFLVAVAVVDADADDLLRHGNGRQERPRRALTGVCAPRRPRAGGRKARSQRALRAASRTRRSGRRSLRRRRRRSAACRRPRTEEFHRSNRGVSPDCRRGSSAASLVRRIAMRSSIRSPSFGGCLVETGADLIGGPHHAVGRGIDQRARRRITSSSGPAREIFSPSDSITQKLPPEELDELRPAQVLRARRGIRPPHVIDEHRKLELLGSACSRIPSGSGWIFTYQPSSRTRHRLAERLGRQREAESGAGEPCARRRVVQLRDVRVVALGEDRRSRTPCSSAPAPRARRASPGGRRRKWSAAR